MNQFDLLPGVIFILLKTSSRSDRDMKGAYESLIQKIIRYIKKLCFNYELHQKCFSCLVYLFHKLQDQLALKLIDMLVPVYEELSNTY
jgi:hypothetical protein